MTARGVEHVGATPSLGLWCFACGDVLGLDIDTPLARCTCRASTLKRSGHGFVYSGPAEGVARHDPLKTGDAVQYVRHQDDEILHREQTQPLV